MRKEGIMDKWIVNPKPNTSAFRIAVWNLSRQNREPFFFSRKARNVKKKTENEKEKPQ